MLIKTTRRRSLSVYLVDLGLNLHAILKSIIPSFSIPNVRTDSANMTVPVPVFGGHPALEGRVAPKVGGVDETSIADKQLVSLLSLIAVVALAI